MGIGVFNPFDDVRTTAVAPAHVLPGAGVRKFFDDALNPIPHSQDFNLLWQNLYSAGDWFGLPDAEGDVNYIRSMFQAINDNPEWTATGTGGTADLSAKRGLKGRLTSGTTAGITSLGAVQAGRMFLMVVDVAAGVRIVPGATILTNGQTIYAQQNDLLLIVGDDAGTQYRVTLIPQTVYPSPSELILSNGDFEIWQTGTTLTPSASQPTALADGWKGRRASAANWTVSRQSGFNGSRYCMRIQRTAGDTSTSPLIVGQQIMSTVAQQLAGKPIIVSFDIRCGASAVTALGAGATLAPNWTNGAGFDETPALATGAFDTPNGSAQGGTFGAGGYVPSTSPTRIACLAFICTAGTTEALWRLIYTPIATAAGASEYIEIANVRVDVGQLSTPFLSEARATTLARLQRRFRKSFGADDVPAQSFGAGTGPRAACTTAGANPQFVTHVDFQNDMAAPPVVTLFNPAAANAQVRNITRSTDSTGAAASNITTKGFDVTCTGASGWSIGDTLEFHWMADARLL